MAKQTSTKEELYNIFPTFPTTICDIIHNYVGNPFIFTLNIESDRSVMIPVISSTSGFIINWGGWR